jgi:hypothetical protein
MRADTSRAFQNHDGAISVCQAACAPDAICLNALRGGAQQSGRLERMRREHCGDDVGTERGGKRCVGREEVEGIGVKDTRGTRCAHQPAQD